MAYFLWLLAVGLAGFWEDASAPELTHSQSLRILQNQLNRMWERK